MDATDTINNTTIDINQHQLQFRIPILTNNLKRLYLHKNQFNLQIQVTIIPHNIQTRVTIHVMDEAVWAGKNTPLFYFFKFLGDIKIDLGLLQNNW